MLTSQYGRPQNAHKRFIPLLLDGHPFAPNTIVVTYTQFNSNIRVLYVLFLKKYGPKYVRTVILHFSASEGENVATIGGKMDSMNRMRM